MMGWNYPVTPSEDDRANRLTRSSKGSSMQLRSPMRLTMRLITPSISRFMLLPWLGFTLAALLNGPQAWCQDSESRPNIIYIMLDDAGYGDFGATGSPAIQTPNFDRICREGQLFRQHYSGSAVCAPTRCVLMTGLHTGHCKRRDNKATGNLQQTTNGLVFLNESDVTVAAALQQAGYVTGGIGKWGLGNTGTAGAPDKQGFDHFLGYLDQVHAHNHYTDWLWNDGQKMPIPGNRDKQQGTYIHDVFEADTLNFIREQASQEQPFFLYLPYTLPHGSYVIPADDPAFQIYADQAWPDNVKNYAAMVTRADRSVGKILELLQELKIDDQTILFYTSDNGPNRVFTGPLKSGGPFRGIKRQLTEGGLRAAMAVRWPGKVPAGTTSEFVWSMIDVFPTLCELAQTKGPDHLDGTSVVPTLLGKSQPPLDHHYFEIHHPFQQAVRVGPWKGFRLGTEEPLKLFDVVADPGESKDVASQHPDVVRQLEQVMREQHVESPFYPSVTKAKAKRKRK